MENPMKPVFLTAAALLWAAAAAAQSDTKVQHGVLTCSLSDSTNLVLYSTVTFDCSFDPDGPAGPEAYVGEIEKIGVDLSTTEAQEITWYVVAPSGDLPKGALNGSYVGVSADVSLGAGVGARALVGGDEDAIQLQPVSVETQKGFGAALGGERFTLTSK
jgi:hypothetical protein